MPRLWTRHMPQPRNFAISGHRPVTEATGAQSRGDDGAASGRPSLEPSRKRLWRGWPRPWPSRCAGATLAPGCPAGGAPRAQATFTYSTDCGDGSGSASTDDTCQVRLRHRIGRRREKRARAVTEVAPVRYCCLSASIGSS